MMRTLCLMLFFAAACTMSSRARTAVAPAPWPAIGLYEVTVLSADNRLDLPERWWETLQYIEIVRGTFYGTAPDELAVVSWSADTRESESYTYEARTLGGHLEGHRFILDDGALGRSWLTLDEHRVPQGEHDEVFRSDTDHEVVVTVELRLRRVERTRDSAKRLPYPERD